MNKYTNFIISHKKLVIGIFFISALLCAFLSTKVGVNYNFADYLPDDAASTKALNVMEDEYKQNVPNMRVMINDVSIADALEYKDKIENVEGVEEVIWLDDKFNISAPMEMADDKLINEWYKDKNALYSITLSEDKKAEAVEDIRDIIGSDNAMSGTAVTDVLSPVNTSKDIMKIIIFVIPIVFVLLIFATNSWFESVLFMITIGVAIIINRGTNLMFGTISFVTNAAGSILQLAVSMDYSIFLLHRFGENRDNGMNVEYAMVNAVKQSLSSVLSSGLTTVTGFAALILMRFKIGPDMGWVMVKAILISLICVLCFLPALSI
ncbi:MMPL family transporter [uncultured Anaerofustis sp.]|uniref:MMPL family transporter n=1 Tax=uncultured Anaerofustis sp. TaxID=904996 RepID=UPI0025FE5911|nr:MMPL family transporter [uncultured Anaerofustis sp.]